MTLHKLSAGEGYTYLTRQVAAHDSAERVEAGLSTYYAERGESPGRWVGSGLQGLLLTPGEVVTQEQMVALFGHGHHPREAELDRSIALGREFPTYAATTLRMEVSQAFSAYNRERGAVWNAAIPTDERARIRTEIAVRRFQERHDRLAVTTRELVGFLAEESRPKAMPVAGYDLTFSPVKSVSALWALAPRDVAEQVAAAHDAAVADVISWLEREVAFTRIGPGGLRQVPVRGLVAAAFTHRDSRAGDPDLHTHVAVSNKVQATTKHGGRWLALDGRVLFKAKVAASERYNTRLEAELVERLGARFVERQDEGGGKRPVREIDGIDPFLLSQWSKRRIAIEARTRRLSWMFEDDHGRSPTSIEAQTLAQRANLETREAKHGPRSEAEQRASWRRQAERDLRESPEAMVTSVLGRPATVAGVNVGAVGRRVVAALEASRATWQIWHVRAEAERQARAVQVPLAQLDATVDALVSIALSDLSVRIDPPDEVRPPAALRRPDGTSVYDVHGATRYSSRRILDAEQVVLTAAGRTDGRRLGAVRVGLAVTEAAANQRLDPSQAALVTALATSGARVQVAVAPAGTGKTTAMRVLGDLWRDSGGTVLGLAPSAAAARELGRALSAETETLAKLVTDVTAGLTTSLTTAVGPSTLLLVDEAGMAATTDLAVVVRFALEHGASVRLIGDDQQLTAVAAGGLLRDLARQVPAPSLALVHRFDSPAEAAATLAVRTGDPTALGFYTDHQRIHVGDALELAYQAWKADRSRGLDSLLLAPTRAAVTSLNEQARQDRLAGASPGRSASLADGTSASAGDVIVTRCNNRRLLVGETNWVKNGDRWRVVRVHRDGSLTAAPAGSRGRRIRLPAAYVASQVQLGYAATVHSAQGMTVDTSHTVLDGSESRQLLYVALSRGRSANHLYTSAVSSSDDAGLPRADCPTPLDVLRGIVARNGAEESATAAARSASDPAVRLHEEVLRYLDGIDLAAPRGPVELDGLRPGPLPWLPAAPTGSPLTAYLGERSERVVTFADQVAESSLTATPAWADGLPPRLTADLAIWRAAYGVPDTDHRPSGPRVDGAARDYQRALDRRAVETMGTAPDTDWTGHVPAAVQQDPSYAQLADRFTGISRRRDDVPEIIEKALADPRPLPAENPADALWWRVVGTDELTPRRDITPPPPLPQAIRRPLPEHMHPSVALRPERSPRLGR